MREELKARMAESCKVHALAQKACKSLQSLTVQLENVLKRKSNTKLANEVLASCQSKWQTGSRKLRADMIQVLHDLICQSPRNYGGIAAGCTVLSIPSPGPRNLFWVSLLGFSDSRQVYL